MTIESIQAREGDSKGAADSAFATLAREAAAIDAAAAKTRLERAAGAVIVRRLRQRAGYGAA